MTNKEEMAKMLDGREYPLNLSSEEERLAKDAGLVVVYGASDDLMEFGGAVYNEISAYNGATAYLTHAGLVENECENDDCPHFKRLLIGAAQIQALWCAPSDDKGRSWTYKTEIPHATFEVMEEGQHYCRGIVFSLADVKP